MLRNQFLADAMRPTSRPHLQYLPRLRALVVAILITFAFVRPAAATDYTDLWVTPGENAWGVNFVQSNNFIFSTFFIYGPDQQPTWYSGEMTQGTNGVWSGPLYRSTGSYFGVPWSESQKTIAQVGTVTFTPTTSFSGTLTYNVADVNVIKSINRLALTPIPLGGTYLGGVVSIVNNCNDPAGNGTFRVFTEVTATQTAQSAGALLTLDLALNGGGSCRFTGNYVLDGTLYRIPNATYTCSGNFSANANVTQIKATAQGIEGQWAAGVGSGCQESGYFSAVLE